MYSSPITPAQVPLVRFELTLDLSPARVLSPAHIPFCYRGIIRSATEASILPVRFELTLDRV